MTGSVTIFSHAVASLINFRAAILGLIAVEFASHPAGRTRFVYFHMLVHGDRIMQETHDLCEKIEAEIRASLPGNVSLTIHVEPLEDPASWDDRVNLHPREISR